MKVGDLVRWTMVEHCYHIACGVPGLDLTEVRKRGIIVDNNGINFFVRWENGDFKAQKPNTIEVISESR
tara:strand:- start:1491 stop:1697 length:207 start_codon:yes stop_codon:yes gene_type:complete